MVFRFSVTKSVTDPAERARRLNTLYKIFEDTPSAAISRQDDNATPGAEAHQSTDRQQRHYAPKRRSGQPEVSK